MTDVRLMNLAAADASALQQVLPTLAAAVAFYLASRGAATLGGTSASSRVSLAAVVPASVAALLAAAVGQGEAALSLVAGAAVATASLVPGLTLLQRRVEASSAEAQQTASLHPAAVLLAAASATLLAGFAGRLALPEVGVLLLLAAAAGAIVWPMLRPGPGGWRAWPILLASLPLAAGAAWLATVGTAGVGRSIGYDATPITATVLAGPMLALPVIGIATRACNHGHRDAAVDGSITAAATLVGVLFPLVLIAIMLRNALAGDGLHVMFPARAWRIDMPVLCVVGLLLLPLVAGRWRPGGGEGIGLVLLYVAYLVVSVAAAR